MFFSPLLYHLFSPFCCPLGLFHAISKYLLSTCYAPGAGNAVENKRDIVPTLLKHVLGNVTRFFKKILLGHLILLVLFCLLCLPYILSTFAEVKNS